MVYLNAQLDKESELAPLGDPKVFEQKYDRAVDTLLEICEDNGVKADTIDKMRNIWRENIYEASNPWFADNCQYYCFEVGILAYFFMIFAKTPLVYLGITFVVGLIINACLFFYQATLHDDNRWISKRGLLILNIVDSAVLKMKQDPEYKRLKQNNIELYKRQISKHRRVLSRVQDFFLRWFTKPYHNLFVVNDFVEEMPHSSIAKNNTIDFEKHLPQSIIRYRNFLDKYQITFKAIKEDLSKFARVIAVMRDSNRKLQYTSTMHWTIAFCLFVYKFHPNTINAIIALGIITGLCLLIYLLSRRSISPKYNLNYNRLTILNLEAQKGPNPNDRKNSVD